MVDSAKAGQCDDTTAASRDNGQTRILSTDGVPLRERFSYWREVVCNATAGLFGTPTEAPPGVFSARAAFRSCGPFRFAVAEAMAEAGIGHSWIGTDLVVHDQLVSKRILDVANPAAEVVCVRDTAQAD
jgi:hypothetical protein